MDIIEQIFNFKRLSVFYRNGHICYITLGRGSLFNGVPIK